MRFRVLVLAGSVAVLLAGCGGSSKTPTATTVTSTVETTTSPEPYAPLPNGEAAKFPDAIVDDAIAAASKATTVHIVGSVSNAGRPLKLNLNLTTGRGGAGTVSVSGLTFDIVRIGATSYFKGGPAFWSHFGGSKIGTAANGRWVEASATTGDLASFTPLTDVKQLFSGVLGSHGPLEKAVNQLKIDGESAIVIIDSGSNDRLFIAANGPPYPLKLAQQGGGTVTFDGWNKPVSLQAPKNAVALDKLKSG
jgi:hypothetical protein